MARNIIFITLFIVLYGGLFLLLSKDGDEVVDRGGFGEFSENHYSCEACNFEMELKPGWIPLDGAAIANRYTQNELYDYFGETGTYDIITGFTSPGLYVECIRYKNITLGNEYFTNSYLYSELEYCKENIRLADGILGSSGSYLFQAQGNGQDMGIYHYDYTLDGVFYSELNCFLNCGNDVLWFYCYYEDKESLGELLTFLNSQITFNSSSAQTV